MAHILVIDDEPNIRMMVRMALEQSGHSVEEAADGIEGLEKFGAGSGWGLTLLDQRMPGLEGLDVLRQMKALNPPAKVIFMTAYATLDLALDAMEEGATDFLRKPFSLETLRGAVEAGLRHYPVSAPLGGETLPGTATLNGFLIEPVREPAKRRSGEIQQALAVQAPNGDLTPCIVVFPPDLVEEIRHSVGDADWPVGDRFWQEMAEEMMAHYLWENAGVPMGAFLRKRDYERHLGRWLGAVSGKRRTV